MKSNHKSSYYLLSTSRQHRAVQTAHRHTVFHHNTAEGRYSSLALLGRETGPMRSCNLPKGMWEGAGPELEPSSNSNALPTVLPNHGSFPLDLPPLHSFIRLTYIFSTYYVPSTVLGVIAQRDSFCFCVSRFFLILVIRGKDAS